MAIVFVQGNIGARNADATALTIAYPNPTAAGNLLVLVVAYFNSGGVLVSDNINGNWTQIPNSPTGSGSEFLGIWYFPNSAGGSITVSLAQAGSPQCYRAGAIGEYSGVATSSPIRSNTTAATGSSVNPATPTCTATAGDLVIAGYAQGSVDLSSGTVAGPFLMEEQYLLGGSISGVGHAADVNTSGNEGATFTLSSSVSWLAQAVSFKPGSVALTSSVQELRQGPPVRGAPFTTYLLPAEAGNLVILAPPAVIIPSGKPALEIRRSPPLRGSPILQRPEPHEASSLFVPAPPPPTPSPSVDIEIYSGPPLRGAPWAVRIRPAEGLGAGASKPAIVPAVPGPGRGVAKPFIERLPDVSDERRLSRITEKLSAMINSLVGQGIIQQTGASAYALRGGGFQVARAPNVTDDITTGAVPSALWIDTSALAAWVCISNGVGAAVWKKITS